MFADHVDGVFGDLHDQVDVADHGLAAQPGIGLQTPGLVEQIFLAFFRGIERGFALTDLDMARRAGAGLLTGVLDLDAVGQCRVADRDAGLDLDDRAVRADLFMG